MERLKYHQAAIDFIGALPLFSQENVDLLNQFERDCDIKLPPSLREWYSLHQSELILNKYSNGDHSKSPCELKTSYLDLQIYKSDYYDPFNPLKLLPVMSENQGCFQWLVHLDGSDDPPVFVTGETLELFTNTFSDFVYTHVWDWSGLYGRNWFRMYSDPGEIGLAFMRQHFQETTRTFSFDHIGGAAYRFFEEDKCVLIKTGEDYNTWHVWASSESRLMELIASLYHNIRFREDLQAAYGTNYSIADETLEPKDLPF